MIQTSERNIKHGVRIRFCGKIGVSSSEALTKSKMAYGKHAMKKLDVFERHRWFKDGRGKVRDDSRSGPK